MVKPLDAELLYKSSSLLTTSWFTPPYALFIPRLLLSCRIFYFDQVRSLDGVLSNPIKCATHFTRNLSPRTGYISLVRNEMEVVLLPTITHTIASTTFSLKILYFLVFESILFIHELSYTLSNILWTSN